MRKTLIPCENFEENISFNGILELLSSLCARVEQLEKEVFPCGPNALSLPQPKPRRGRKPKLDTGELLKRRIDLTAWLEQNWPRLSVAVRRAEKSCKSSDAIAEFSAVKRNGVVAMLQLPFRNSPEQFETAFGDFLKSGRFHGNPRNLAAAMAGLPELSWKRSFDICSNHPYKTGYMLPVYRDYMKRRFSDRLRELDEARTELDVKIVLARSRTDDPVYIHLKENPDKVKKWLEAGKPKGPSSLDGHR